MTDNRKEMRFTYAELQAISEALAHWGTHERDLRKRVDESKDALWKIIRKGMPDLMG